MGSLNWETGARYRRIAARRGPQEANVAIQHSMLTAIWCMGHTGALYDDPGPDYFTRLHPQRAKTGALHQLEPWDTASLSTAPPGTRKPYRDRILRVGRPPVSVQGTSVGFGAMRVREADADGCVACLGQLKSIKLGGPPTRSRAAACSAEQSRPPKQTRNPSPGGLLTVLFRDGSALTNPSAAQVGSRLA